MPLVLPIVVGSSVPYLMKSLGGKSDSKLTEAERTEIAAREANSALRDIAVKHGLKPQDLSNRIAGGAAPAAAKEEAPAPAADVVAPAPAPDLFIVDRYLAAAASGGVQGVIVINKMDMPGSAELSAALEPYRRIGYEVFECSAQQPASLDLLSERLRAHTSVFVGQSGVGKSSLAAQLVPGSDIAVGGLARDDEGRHTTTASRLYDLPGGGALIDSPGVRDFAPAIAALEPKSLGFIEVERLAPGCRFQDCRHMREPGCAVMAAVDTGGFDARRYESYRRLRRLFEDLTAARGPVRRS